MLEHTHFLSLTSPVLEALGFVVSKPFKGTSFPKSKARTTRKIMSFAQESFEAKRDAKQHIYRFLLSLFCHILVLLDGLNKKSVFPKKCDKCFKRKRGAPKDSPFSWSIRP